MKGHITCRLSKLHILATQTDEAGTLVTNAGTECRRLLDLVPAGLDMLLVGSGALNKRLA
jgi:hypothetical protein